jgi:hypothetical protein
MGKPQSKEQKAIAIATQFDGMPIEEARAILARAAVLLGSNQIFSAKRITADGEDADR